MSAEGAAFASVATDSGFVVSQTGEFAVGNQIPGLQVTRELLDFLFLSDDRSVQATRFTDGTEVLANLGEDAHDVDGYGSIPGMSWRRSQVDKNK